MDMNRLKDGIREKVNTVKMLAVFCAGLLSIGMTACDDGLDVTQAYPFTVEDNFGNSFEWETDFNNDSDAEEAPSGNDTLNTVKGGVYQ